MLGSSRQSMRTLSDSLESTSGVTDRALVSSDLLAVATMLTKEQGLVTALADSGQAAADRASIVDQLLSGKISDGALAVSRELASSRWSSSADLIDGFEQLGEQAAFIQAQRDNDLDRVEHELFTFKQALDGSPELQLLLTDPAVANDRKASVVRDVLGEGASPITVKLLTYTAANLRGRRPLSALDALSDLAAAQRNRLVAEVRSAIPLSESQSRRLSSALSALQGRAVELNVIVDPSVLGGIVVQIGDEVIDGSIASRLDEARRTVTA